MTVIRKPKTVEDFITGSPVAAENDSLIESLTDIQPVKLRMPIDLLSEIDEARSKRKPRPSRHQYILEALYEKVAKERNSIDSKRENPWGMR